VGEFLNSFNIAPDIKAASASELTTSHTLELNMTPSHLYKITVLFHYCFS